jgi:hypothetical protein
MAWTIPDKGEGLHDHQSILFQEYLDILVAGLQGTECVLAGCAISPQGSPDMSVVVQKGGVISGSVMREVAAVASRSIAAADATHPRIDLIVANNVNLLVRQGAPAAVPKPQPRTANDVVLAAVYVPAGATSIAAANITDMRVFRGGSSVGGGGAPILVRKITSPVTVSNNASEVNLLSQAIPAGVFLPGNILRVRLGGTYLSNSGTPTFTWRVKFGGTTMFQDVTGTTTADADRGAWFMEFELVCQAASDQQVSGNISFQTPGAKTAPAAGQGDLAATTHINAPIAGSAAVDTDVNGVNPVLQVSIQMSVANANVQTVCEVATVELI